MSVGDDFRRPESVLVLVYTHQGDVLLMERVDTPDFWQSITGGLEKEEAAIDAAIRELNEETGLEIQSQGLHMTDHHCSTMFEISGVWRKRYHPDHAYNREHLFSLRLEKPVTVTLDEAEHRRCVWLPAEQAMVRATSRTNKQAIEDIVLSAQHRQ